MSKPGCFVFYLPGFCEITLFTSVLVPGTPHLLLDTRNYLQSLSEYYLQNRNNTWNSTRRMGFVMPLLHKSAIWRNRVACARMSFVQPSELQTLFIEEAYLAYFTTLIYHKVLINNKTEQDIEQDTAYRYDQRSRMPTPVAL